MPSQRIVVVGASAGGIEALRELVAGLPADFPAPLCIVLHMAPQSPGVLPEILSRAGQLRVAQARTGERLRPGWIYTAPPDQHMLVEPGRLKTTRGPRENRFRPAVDPLFRTAAQVYGPGTIGVVLTGNLDDGTAGLYAIKRLGGIAVVQDPADAMFPGMPESAQQHVEVDHVVPLSSIATLLTRLTAAPIDQMHAVGAPDHFDVEIRIAKEENAMDAGLSRVATPSPYACPECHGVLLQLKQEGRIRFRCHTGHAYSLDSLIASISEGIEISLWESVRALEEGALLMGRFSEHVSKRPGGESSARELAERSKEAHHQAKVIRELLQSREPLAADVNERSA